MRSNVEDLGQVVGRAAFILIKIFFGNLFERAWRERTAALCHASIEGERGPARQDAVIVLTWGAVLRRTLNGLRDRHGQGATAGRSEPRPYKKKTARRYERVVVSDKNAGKMPALPRAELWR
jgi:hypothetical protein